MTAAKGHFPYNRTITLTMADKIVSMVKAKGAHYAIEYCGHYGLKRHEMRDFIRDNFPTPPTLGAA